MSILSDALILLLGIGMGSVIAVLIYEPMMEKREEDLRQLGRGFMLARGESDKLREELLNAKRNTDRDDADWWKEAK